MTLPELQRKLKELSLSSLSSYYLELSRCSWNFTWVPIEHQTALTSFKPMINVQFLKAYMNPPLDDKLSVACIWFAQSVFKLQH